MSRLTGGGGCDAKAFREKTVEKGKKQKIFPFLPY